MVNCQHPGCTEEREARRLYCLRHSTRRMQHARWRMQRQARQKAGLSGKVGLCAVCQAEFTKSGQNQRYCPDHRDCSRHRPHPSRVGSMYVPEGMTYAAFVALVTGYGISMHTYSRRRRGGESHEQALRGRDADAVTMGKKPKPVLSYLTAEQQRANELLRAWRCLTA